MSWPGQVQVGRMSPAATPGPDRWLPTTESGLQVCYGNGPLGGRFYFGHGSVGHAAAPASRARTVTAIRSAKRVATGPASAVRST